MRQAIWSSTLSTASSEPVFSGGGRTRTLTIRRSVQAKRMWIEVDPRDGAVRLTLPRRAALKAALAWAESHRGWIERALGALPPPQPVAAGGTILFEGSLHRIEWQPGGRSVRREGDLLIVGGPAELLAARLLRWMRGEAKRVLEMETRALAARSAITIGRVRVGDARSRWGSCSSSGDIAYSWRLILAPPAVREATVAHEVAHRLHMDHSPAFHAAVARLLGREPVGERAWLKANGARLHAVGRAD